MTVKAGSHALKEKITAEVVFAAAEAIVARKREPTLASLRLHLGNRGSLTTLHKYLKQWKEERFKVNVAGEISEQYQDLAEKARLLETALNQQTVLSEQYASDLIHTEKELLQIKAESLDLKTENQTLKEALQESRSEKESLERLYLELKAERKYIFDQILSEKNQLIEELREELKTVNQQALAMMKELGFSRDEALMQEKVKIIQLEDKCSNLSDENKKLLLELNKIKSVVSFRESLNNE